MAASGPSPSVSLGELLDELPGGIPGAPDGGDDQAHASAAVYSNSAIASTLTDPAPDIEDLGREVWPGPSNGDALHKSADPGDGTPAPSRETWSGARRLENGMSRDETQQVAATDQTNEPAAAQTLCPETVRDAHAWLRDRGSVDLALMNGRFMLLVCGLLGSLLPIIQNELIFREHDPSSSVMNFLKFCNMLVSLAMLGLLVRHYRLYELFQRIRMHLRALHPLDTDVPFSAPLKRTEFWVEALICVPFLPPFVTFELITYNWLNIVMYRAETIFCLYNSFRLYLFLPVVRDYELRRLPKRHTISSFTNTGMNSAFALKRILNGHDAMLVIGCFWASSFLITGYWFRAVEISACGLQTTTNPLCNVRAAKFWTLESDRSNEFEKRNDLYLWNAFWGMFITATSVGYGDILATTHAGRFVSAVAATAGLVFTAALTAALSIKLSWTEQEQAAMLVVKREQARLAIRNFAIKLLQNWVRASSTRTSREMREKLLRRNWQIKQDFAVTKMATKVDLADCMADSAKFDNIYQRTKYILEAIQDIEQKTRQDAAESQAQEDLLSPVAGVDSPAPIYSAAERQESFIVRSAKEVLKKDVQRQQSKMGSFKLKGGSFSLKRPATTGTQESLRKVMMNQKLRELAKVAGTTAYMAQQAGVKTSNLPENPGQSPVTDEPWPQPRKMMVLDWRRNRVKVDNRINQCKIGLSVVAILASMIVMGQNEWVIRGNDPRASVPELSKIFSVICCVVLFALLYLQYWLRNILRRLNLHLKRGHDFVAHVPVSEVLSSHYLWVEVLLCCVCLPPGVTGELSLQSMDNVVVYRWETIMASWTILSRLYLQWNIVCAWTLSDVPNRQNVAAFANIQFDSMFVMKRLVNSWSAAKHLFLAWVFCTLTFGYLYRNAEISACFFSYTQHPDCLLPEAQTWVVYGNKFEKANDLFIWNAMWLSFVTMTTVGYGDSVPATHIGRFVCSCATIAGLLLASLITAAITNLLAFNQQEHAAISVIEREQARLRMRRTAVTIIVLWWRRKRHIPLSRRLARLDKHVLRREFLEHKLETLQEVEDLQGMSVKLHKVSSHIKHIELKLEDIAKHLWSKDEVLSMEKAWETKATADDTDVVRETDNISMDDLMDRVGDEPNQID